MFKKGVYNCFVALLTAIVLTGCVNDVYVESDMPANGEPYIALQLFSGTQTRASENLLTDKEKAVESVDLFFYTKSASEEERAVMVWHGSKPDENGNLTVRILKERIDDVFGTDDEQKCKVYAIVNSPEATAKVLAAVDYYNEHHTYGDTAPTVADIREWKSTTKEFSESREFVKFVMFSSNNDGDVVTYKPNDKKASGEIHVKALAAKIDLFVNIAKDIEAADPAQSGTSVTWNAYEPTKTAEAYIVNGVQAVRLNGWNDSSFLTDEDYFDLRNTDYSRILANSKEEDYRYVIDNPFYTYPNQWTTDPLEQHRTTLMVKVNWLPKNGNLGTDLRETYYLVPINMSGDDANRLSSGKYYRIKININTLGSLNMGEPAVLEECSYEILDWGDAGMDADAREPRFLEVTQSVYDNNTRKNYTAVMNNISNTTIPYYSSHRVGVKDIKITYLDFNTSNYEPVETNVLVYKQNGMIVNAWDQTSPIEDTFILRTKSELNDAEVSGLFIDQQNQQLYFQHTLSSIAVSGSNYKPIGERAYSPYWITFTLYHIDDESVTETVNIIQYPAIFVDYEFNDGKLGHLVGNSGMNGTLNRGGVYVNGGASKDWASGIGDNDSRNNVQLGGVAGGLRTGENYSNNPNMYIFHITQLSDNDNVQGQMLHLGDPRTKYFNNYLMVKKDWQGNTPGVETFDTSNLMDDDLADVAENESKGLWNNKGSEYGARHREAPYGSTSSISANRLYPVNGGAGAQTIAYYYPTHEGQMPEEAYMVAPSFRINSSYGDIRGKNGSSQYDNQSRQNARIRCASYQEQGYPAGRWRLPTYGEFAFLVELHKNNVIPDLFGEERAHWTAQGLYKVVNGEIVPFTSWGDSKYKFVRCVYDDWYWVKEDSKGNLVPDNLADPEYQEKYKHLYQNSPFAPNKDLREIFFWGDKPKNNPQVQTRLMRAMQVDKIDK